MADAYHVESRYTRDNLRGLGLDESVPIWLIHSAVDARHVFVPDSERPVRSSDEPFRVLTVGRLAVAKGVEFALDAVARIHRAGIDVEYTIVGDGDYRAALRTAARQLGLEDAGVVRFAGGASRDEVVEHYRTADVVLHASTDEGMPYVVLEAQAMELPVVVTAAAGTPDAVDDGVTGFVVPPRDSSALAERLVTLARDPGLARQMGRAGRQWVLDDFNEEEWIRQYVVRYRELGGVSDAGVASANATG
jgi:glycosyltransferase involved in cell wall biosynthesis